MDIYHGGLCHIDKEKGTEVDHFLYFKPESLNYEIGATMQCVMLLITAFAN